jgi:hypothetical protein
VKRQPATGNFCDCLFYQIRALLGTACFSVFSLSLLRLPLPAGAVAQHFAS